MGKNIVEYNLIFVNFGPTVRQNMDFSFFLFWQVEGQVKVTLEGAFVRKRIHAD